MAWIIIEIPAVLQCLSLPTHQSRDPKGPPSESFEEERHGPWQIFSWVFRGPQLPDFFGKSHGGLGLGTHNINPSTL